MRNFEFALIVDPEPHMDRGLTRIDGGPASEFLI